MDAVLNWFDWVSEVIESVFDWFSDFLENLLNLFEYLGQAVELTGSLIAALPPWLQVFATITITVSVVFIILGRSTGGKKQ